VKTAAPAVDEPSASITKTVTATGAEQIDVKVEDEKKGLSAELLATFQSQEDAPACSDCGAIMVRNAACYKCLNCGSTSGCS
jgi:ribonucleoside-diphosphate reductase alpha chain